MDLVHKFLKSQKRKKIGNSENGSVCKPMKEINEKSKNLLKLAQVLSDYYKLTLKYTQVDGG